jgi:uncharacterized membrane protein YphA (DoxX/SURF4 family)
MARRAALLFARVTLAAGFLSAVADRFGLWGPPGGPNVAWGDFDRFLRYAATINPYLPAAAVPAVGWLVTAAEVVVAVLLLAGWQVRWAALAAGLLLVGFAAGMTMGTGVKTALDASVPAAAAAAFLLAAFSLDKRTFVP